MPEKDHQFDQQSASPAGVEMTNFAQLEQAFAAGKQAPRISGYDILSMLGAGGMGTVWRARQHGTGRDVALKLLTDRPADARAPARFIREVELASRLEHPNIARVYESGVHDGEFYYAMELVEGVPLDLWARQRKLDEAAILELMRVVCDAVQHAHYKGIIHRDLKPSNILVSHDGQARLLDFGLARPITPGAAAIVSDDRSAVAGTPAYMSPEQAASRADQIDTRSDVYSLGKILYELLLGKPAHDLGGSQYDLWRRVVEDEIRRPREVKPALSADLESVLLKALDRDARNRYASAGDLGADLKNILAGDPVSARPATLSYFVGKKLARHKRVVLAAITTAIVLAGAGIFGVARITHERNVANAERIEARREAANATAMNRFFQLVLDSLDPKNARGVNNVGREMMERADRSLSESFAGDAHTEASIRIALGKNMLALGQFATAESQLGRARDLLTKAAAGHDVQSDEPLLLSAEDLLAQVERERGNISLAADLTRHVVERSKALFGEKDARTLAAMNTLSYVLNDLGRRDEAETVARMALRLSGEIVGPEDLLAGRSIPLTLNIASTLTRHLADSNDPAKINEAMAWARQICAGWRKIAAAGTSSSAAADAQVEIPLDPQSLEAYADLASVLNRQSESDPKVELDWRIVAQSPTGFGPEQPLMFALSKAALGFVESEIRYQTRWDEQINLHRRVVEKGAAVLGPDHPDLLIWKNNMAVALEARKGPSDLLEAEQIYRSLLPAAMEVRGSQHRYTVIALNGLATALRLEGRSAADYDQQVETYSTRALDRLLPEFGPQNAQALWFLDAQAQALKYQGKLEASEAAYVKALHGRETLFGPAHRDTLTTAWNLGVLYTDEHLQEKADPILSETLKTCERVLPPNDPLTRNVRRTMRGAQWTPFGF